MQTDSKVPSIISNIVDTNGLEKPRLTMLLPPGGSEIRRVLHSERCKTIMCFFYFCFNMIMVDFAMSILQFRIPDQEKHPPLPDIFLDNITIKPLAYVVSEMIIMSSLVAWVFVIFLHKRRIVLLRRFGCLMGIAYLPRGFSVLMTSLPVAVKEEVCIKREDGSLVNYFQLAYRIFFTGGFRLRGLHTCGDYMYSGHTVALTLSTCFIREYTPRRWIFVYVITWSANVAGMFCILASHEHYSIDIFIAFILTFGAFHFYHALANNRESLVRKRNRTFPFFPFFYYFEPEKNFRVKNEFEWPLSQLEINFTKNEVTE